MLDEFLTANRAPLIERCRAKVAARPEARTQRLNTDRGVPILIDQLITTLKAERASGPNHGRDVPKSSEDSEIKAHAMLHGRDLLREGFTVGQVVHEYGDLCQAVTEMAAEDGAPIKVDEFRILNRCLDDAIAGAVSEFSKRCDSLRPNNGMDALHERLSFLDHELHKQISTAMLAVTAIRSGHVGSTGSTGAILDHSLISLRDLVARHLADIRLTIGTPQHPEQFSIYTFVDDIEISGSLEARAKGCTFNVADVDTEMMVYGDRDMLLSVAGNLLHNAFRFTKPRSVVSLKAHASGDRILIDIEDQCGGHPVGESEKLFLPSTRSGTSGLELGLPICRLSVEANNGILHVRDIPGQGCVYTIDLPRHIGDLPSPIH